LFKEKTTGYLNVIVEVVHDAGRVGRHEEGSLEREVESEVKRNFLVSRIDEDAHDTKG
jgi:hypothetical protein